MSGEQYTYLCCASIALKIAFILKRDYYTIAVLYNNAVDGLKCTVKDKKMRDKGVAKGLTHNKNDGERKVKRKPDTNHASHSIL
jgi:hypothetical protein